jgi:hypothetical protein
VIEAPPALPSVVRTPAWHLVIARLVHASTDVTVLLITADALDEADRECVAAGRDAAPFRILAGYARTRANRLSQPVECAQ